jgi:hypothetical protein
MRQVRTILLSSAILFTAVPEAAFAGSKNRYFGPMPNSTPMMVPRGRTYVDYGNLAKRGARAVIGSGVIQRGYPTVGKVIRGGPAGTLFYPSCVGEGCSGWKGKVFP